MRKILTALCLLTSPALAEEITAGEWQLLALDGARFAESASLAIDAAGKIAGRAPCNRYFGTNGATLPALSLGGLGATRMACGALAEEQAYLTALGAMTAAELRDDHLILTGPEGRVMEFVRDPGAKDLVCLTCRD